MGREMVNQEEKIWLQTKKRDYILVDNDHGGVGGGGRPRGATNTSPSLWQNPVYWPAER